MFHKENFFNFLICYFIFLILCIKAEEEEILLQSVVIDQIQVLSKDLKL